MRINTIINITLLPALALGALVLGGCGTEVTRTDSSASKDLSGRWNDVDAKTVASDLIEKATSDAWADKFKSEKGKNPVVKLGTVIVRTVNEPVSTDIFLKEIRKAFIRSGKVTVKDETKATREELNDQSGMAANAKEMGAEAAPDFLLKGTLNVQNDQEGRQSVKYYQIDLELTDVKTGIIIWTDGTKIRKEVEQSRWK